MRPGVVVSAFIVAVATVVASCSGSENGKAGSANTGDSRPVAASKVKITTPEGRYRIGKVETGDRYPASCPSTDRSLQCAIAPAGSQFVAVTFAPEFKLEQGAVSWVSRAVGTRIISLRSGDGTTFYPATVLTQAQSGEVNQVTVLWSVPSSTSQLTLHVPDTAPIDLQK